MEKFELRGRVIEAGEAEGEALVTSQPISFLGGVSEEGRVVEKGHELEGELIRGRVLCFPHAKGSSVGVYVIYRLKKMGNAPAAFLLEKCDPTTACGAIIAEIPCVDKLELGLISTGDRIRIRGEVVEVEKRKSCAEARGFGPHKEGRRPLRAQHETPSQHRG